MHPVRIHQSTSDEINAHAAEAFPSECCGFIVERNGREEAVRVSNMQDKLHALDPETYPRTSAIAYTMGKEQLPVLRGAEKGELIIRAVYHSHPQHDAYFSDEDRRNAAPDGEATFPDAGQIVISVYDGVVKGAKAFRWQPESKQYVDAPLTVGP
jgi:[CysO sulfur-carrier protein]-S-L-cysteine hydrolase